MTSLRYALRALRHQPGFAFVATLTLALGIGATTSIFTVVDAVVLRPLSFDDPSRVMVVQETAPQFPAPISLSVLNYPDLRTMTTGFERMSAVRNTTMNLTGTDDPVRVSAKMIGFEMLPVLGVQPLIGRGFTADDDRAGAAPVALLSYSLWQSRFGGRDALVNQAIQLDGRSVTVVGVMPQDFRLFAAADVYVPLMPWLSVQAQDRTWHPGILGVARLKAGASQAEAQRDLDRISAQLEKAYPESNLKTRFIATPALDVMVQGVRTALYVLAGAVGGVLLISCINVAGLLLARGLAKKRETAVRTALGASRRDIISMALMESLVLAVVGAAAGLVLAAVLVPALVQLVGPALPRAESVTVNTRVMFFALALSVITALLFGLLPALASTRVEPRDVLADGGRGSTAGRAQQRARRLLVAAEVALTLTLLVGAGLLMQSFARLQGVSPGFAPDRLLVAELPLSPRTYAADDARTNTVERLLERVTALPGVTKAAVTTFLPMSGAGGLLHFNIQGRQPQSAKDWIMASPRAVTHSYFETMGIPVRRGRGFTRDDRQGAPHTVIVNEAFVKQFMPQADPLGQHISWGTEYDGSLPWLEIVGVVGDVKQAADADGRAEMFVPYEQYPDPFFSRMYQNITVVMRAAADPRQLSGAFRQAVLEIDPNQPIVNVRTMETVMSSSVAQPKFRTVLLGMFAAIALVLAGVGIYGLLAHGVTQRRSEFGVRLALGATSGQVVSLVVKEGLWLAAAGAAVGLVGAAFAVRLLSSMLFTTSPWDVRSWAVAVAALLVVALVASWIPARRATRISPSRALQA